MREGKYDTIKLDYYAKREIDMLEILKAVIYGIVEGVTEWLPISSTGHLILVEQLIPFKGVSDGFFDMFDVVIQLGAIMAVVILFVSLCL